MLPMYTYYTTFYFKYYYFYIIYLISSQLIVYLWSIGDNFILKDYTEKQISASLFPQTQKSIILTYTGKGNTLHFLGKIITGTIKTCQDSQIRHPCPTPTSAVTSTWSSSLDRSSSTLLEKRKNVTLDALEKVEGTTGLYPHHSSPTSA